MQLPEQVTLKYKLERFVSLATRTSGIQKTLVPETMKRNSLFLLLFILAFSSCKEADSPSPYNLNGLWEGDHVMVRTAGENCEEEIVPDQFRMQWRVSALDTITATEQEFSDFSKRWFNLTTTWRGAVTNDSIVRITKYYEGSCNPAAERDSVVFRGNVRIENGFLVLNFEGTETRCPSLDKEADACTYKSTYQLKKKIGN